MDAVRGWGFFPASADDFDGLLVPDGTRDDGDAGSLAALSRVLLREGVASGAVALSTVGWVDWNEHAVVDIRIRAVPEGALALEFNENALAMSARDIDVHEPEEGKWVDVFDEWAEFRGADEGGDLDTMRWLTQLHFDDLLAEGGETALGEGVLGAEARFSPGSLSDDEEAVVEILAERFTEDEFAPGRLLSDLQDSDPEDYEGLICSWLRDTCREFAAADVAGLLELNERWGEAPLYARVEPVLTTFSVVPAEDPMMWKGLAEERQRVALKEAPEWLRALAVVVPGTADSNLRWLATSAGPLVRTALLASPNVSDEIKALAALVSRWEQEYAASGTFDGPPTWDELVDLLRVRGPVTHWWQAYGPSKPSQLPLMVEPRSEAALQPWGVSEAFIPVDSLGTPIDIAGPCELRDRVAAAVEAAYEQGMVAYRDDTHGSGLAGRWQTDAGDEVVQSAEFVSTQGGVRCLWTAPMLANDLRTTSADDAAQDRIALLFQQLGYLLETPLRSGLLRLADISRDAAFPGLPTSLHPRPVVIRREGDYELNEDDDGERSWRRCAEVIRFGYLLDGGLDDEQLAAMLEFSIDSLTACASILWEGDVEFYPEGIDLEGWLDREHTGLRRAGGDADDLADQFDRSYGESPGFNPFALWPPNPPELQGRIGDPNPEVRLAALVESAAQGNGDVMLLLAEMAAHEGDMSGLLRWLEGSARSGLPEGMLRYGATIAEAESDVSWVHYLVSAALCGNGQAMSSVDLMARRYEELPEGTAMLDDPNVIATFISTFQEEMGWPVKLPLLRRSAQLGWPGALGNLTWWALMNGHIDVGLEQGMELLPLVSQIPTGGDAARWLLQLGNARSNIAYLRLCSGESADAVAADLMIWAGARGEGAAPTEAFLIPLIAQARRGDPAGASANLASWSAEEIAECRAVAGEMATGIGPVAGLATDIRSLLAGAGL